MNIVLMAAYNGEKYIRQQIDSILEQIGKEDLLMISLDPSTDGTRTILEQYQQENPNIRILNGPGKGVQKNFEHLLDEACKIQKTAKADPEKTLIFLSDQDDIWHPDKISRCSEILQNEQALLLVHNALMTDRNGNRTGSDYFSVHKTREGFIQNIVRNSFIGSCMVFRGSLMKDILPFADPIPMHDQWIGLQACRKGKVVFSTESLIDYRRHESNATSMQSSSLKQMLIWRAQIIRALLLRRI